MVDVCDDAEIAKSLDWDGGDALLDFEGGECAAGNAGGKSPPKGVGITWPC